MIKSLFTNSDYNKRFLKILRIKKLRDVKNGSEYIGKKGNPPGASLTYFNYGGVRQRFIFNTQKNPNFRICLPKKIPQCFCISKFYYLSSGKLKHANFNFVKGLELRDLLNISLWIRCAWSGGNYFSHRFQSQK